MKHQDRYMREYYDKLQELRDMEDELEQKEKRKQKNAQKRLRQLAKILDAWSGVAGAFPPKVFEAVWKGQYRNRPEFEPITKFLFPDSK